MTKYEATRAVEDSLRVARRHIIEADEQFRFQGDPLPSIEQAQAAIEVARRAAVAWHEAKPDPALKAPKQKSRGQ